jgi:uncharacterized membrane protein
MDDIKKKLENWKREKLISDEQLQGIIEYEEKLDQTSFLFYFFMMLGVFILGLGVISLVAYNWYSIPDAFKLFTNYSILLVISFFLFQKINNQNSNIVSDNFIKRGLSSLDFIIFLYMMFLMSSIGLHGQIYNSMGKLYDLYLFWSFICFPLLFLTSGNFIYTFYSVIFLSSLYPFLESFLLLKYYLRFNYFFIILTLGFFISRIKEIKLISHYFKSITFFIIFGLIWIFDFTYENDFLLSNKLMKTNIFFDDLSMSFPVSIFLSVLICIFDDKDTKRRILTIMIGVFLYISFLLFYNELNPFLIRPIITFVLFFLMSLYVIGLKYYNLFTFFIMMIALRFLIFYFDAFKGLLQSAVGLLFTGVMIIGLTWVWFKNIKFFRKFIEDKFNEI